MREVCFRFVSYCKFKIMVSNKCNCLLFYILLVFISVSGYESRYDSIGPEAIIRNKRLYQKYFDCIVRNGKCTPDARFIKEIVGDALPNLCSSCNDRQKYFADTLISFMIENKPKDFEELEKKYDPKGLFRKDLQKRKADS